MNEPTLNVSLKNKRIYFNRTTITLLGNPSHLSFGYDENDGLLYVSAAEKDDLDAFEIPKFFWRSSQSCQMARIAFLKALQYRLNWEDDSRYSYVGTSMEQDGITVVAFKMTEGKKKVN